jgi:hypothetical protein
MRITSIQSFEEKRKMKCAVFPCSGVGGGGVGVFQRKWWRRRWFSAVVLAEARKGEEKQRKKTMNKKWLGSVVLNSNMIRDFMSRISSGILSPGLYTEL